MRANGLPLTTTLVGLCLTGATQAQAQAQAVTDPVSNLGIIASHNQYKWTIEDESDKERLNQGGLFYTFGNKLTGQEGFIYQLGFEGQYAENNDLSFRTAKAEIDLGARAALSTNNYLDLIVGAGYDWKRAQQDDVRVALFEDDLKLTIEAPFAKAGLGYNYLTPNYSLRLELGARYSIEGRSKLEYEDADGEVDLKDEVNPYGELSVMWNKGINSVPITTSLYYTQTRYKLEGDSALAERSKLKQEEVGLKLGLAF